MRKLFLAGILVIATLAFLPANLWGAEFCVTNAAELQNALSTAATNGQDDTIKVVQGTYSGNFEYNSGKGHSITLLGGYYTGCTSRVVDPANTVLDGHGRSLLCLDFFTKLY